MEGMQPPSDVELVRRALGATSDQERTAAFAAIADKYRLILLRQCASWYPDPDAAQDIGQATASAMTRASAWRGPLCPTAPLPSRAPCGSRSQPAAAAASSSYDAQAANGQDEGKVYV
jgi:hypothetical protein